MDWRGEVAGPLGQRLGGRNKPPRRGIPLSIPTHTPLCPEVKTITIQARRGLPSGSGVTDMARAARAEEAGRQAVGPLTPGATEAGWDF